MLLKKIAVENFRLLRDVELLLEPRTTVIVGRNNSGKTSLTEVMKRLLAETTPTFRMEDFSFGAHAQFWAALTAKLGGADDATVRGLLPEIVVRLTFAYSAGEPLGLLSDFVIDLNPGCMEALVVVRFGLKEGKLGDLFAELANADDAARLTVFRALKDRLSDAYTTRVIAVDPNDATNEQVVDMATLRRLCATGFISAQRGLDDASSKERVVIGRVLENLFTTAKLNAEDTASHTTAEQLETAVKEIEIKIGEDFNTKLDALLPALAIFGYPGLADPRLRTETTLDVERLLTNHTKVRYAGANGINLPEAYNGLGARNIILILLQLREFFKVYCATEPRPAVHIVFVEEPEVHLHPQMQEVFIRKLGEIAEVFSAEQTTPWPVQFIVSTHSSHVANEAHFASIRYFLPRLDAETTLTATTVKDLRQGLSDQDEADKTFLHQYMTLTRCDLFFADKAILIEGTTERLLLPRIIKMVDQSQAEGKKLASQYLSIIEVGGAYAHIFFDLLEFLEVRTLVITDIDTVKPNGAHRLEACQVTHGQATSNACIKNWFNNAAITPPALLGIVDAAKIVGQRRIAFQQPETAGGPCGRSFEDAFMLANPTLFPLTGPSDLERETQAWEAAAEVKKSEFALNHALSDTTWAAPRYIIEGLLWLAEGQLPPQPAVAVTPGVAP